MNQIEKEAEDVLIETFLKTHCVLPDIVIDNTLLPTIVNAMKSFAQQQADKMAKPLQDKMIAHLENRKETHGIDKPYLRIGRQAFTIPQLIEEVTNWSTIGSGLVSDIIILAIDLLHRDKKQLPTADKMAVELLDWLNGQFKCAPNFRKSVGKNGLYETLNGQQILDTFKKEKGYE